MHRSTAPGRFVLVIALPVALALAAAGCTSPEPVGSLSVEPSVIRLRYPEAIGLQLNWTPTASLKRINGRATVFVHLVDAMDQVVRTFDHPLPGEWEPGVPQSYSIDIAQSALAPPLAPGSYGLSLGLYDVDWGYRWPIETGGTEIGKREYRVATVEVASDEVEGPRFDFTSGWLAAERRGDRQVPKRRRLAEDAGVRIGNLAQPGTLLFVLTVHDDTRKEPLIRVQSSCDGSQRRLSGAGSHSIELHIAPADGVTNCVVEFESRGSLAGCGDRCPAYLEQATFRPDPR